MKKRYFLLCLFAIAHFAFAQVVPDSTTEAADAVAPGTSATDTAGIQINANTLVIRVDSAVGLSPFGNVVDTTPKEESDLTDAPSVSRVSVYKIFWSVVIFALGYFIIRFLTKLVQLIGERSTNYRIMIKGFVPVVRIIGWIIVIFIIVAGVLQPQIATVLALTASVGVAVGFASQDILKNIFGGVIILLDAPFKVGDKIEIGAHYGEVVEIGLRSTRIVTPDDSLVSIPNGELMNQSVSNSNAGELNCQVVAEIYLPLDIDTERVRHIALEAAQTSRYIFLNKPITVLFFNEVKERRSYYKMRLKAYVMDIRYEFIFKSELTEIVIRELLHQQIIAPEDYA